VKKKVQRPRSSAETRLLREFEKMVDRFIATHTRAEVEEANRKTTALVKRARARIRRRKR
jgi:hypothetical protein